MTNRVTVALNVNNVERSVDAEPRRSLADCIRHDLGLTGTHVGCEHGVCGACTILLNGEAVRSCLILAVQCESAEIKTVESLATSDVLSVLQEEFHQFHALQCGFCTPGILMSAHALLTHEPNADDERILEVLGGHICRCTGYVPIFNAMLSARAKLLEQ